jgi:hypothetical protein
MNILRNKVLIAGLGIALTSTMAFAGGEPAKRSKRAERPVDIKVVPVGPTQEIIDKAKQDAERSAAVQKTLAGTIYRLLELNYVEEANPANVRQMPTRYKATFYDYTNDRVFAAFGSLDNSTPVTITEEFYQPTASDEEYYAAVRILQSDSQFGARLREESLRTNRPMPPVSVLSGTTERLINVALIPSDAGTSNEIIGVSLKRGVAVRYAENAPPLAVASPEACGPSSSGSSVTGQAGQYQLQVSQGPTVLWDMLVIRPGASSGTAASGIEVRDVKYKGKSVLKRGHVPILNVQYVGNACGPYRDWQDEEGMFNAPAAGATDPAPGIRVLATGQVATTIVESGADAGNFNGVAIYRQGTETVMVSEMNAGWYRYIMEWRFDNNGTIRPRYGFGATNSSCVCNIHNHHAYWRLDFDIVNSNNNVYQVERGRRFQQPVTNEMTRLKNHQTKRSLLIQNASGDEAYMLSPNPSDGVADTFGLSDMWVMKYKPTVASPITSEIDDGRVCCSSQAEALINNWVNNEDVKNTDVVVWYAAHFIHADGANLLNPDRSGLILTGTHVVGPDLIPVRW